MVSKWTNNLLHLKKSVFTLNVSIGKNLIFIFHWYNLHNDSKMTSDDNGGFLVLAGIKNEEALSNRQQKKSILTTSIFFVEYYILQK